MSTFRASWYRDWQHIDFFSGNLKNFTFCSVIFARTAFCPFKDCNPSGRLLPSQSFHSSVILGDIPSSTTKSPLAGFNFRASSRLEAKYALYIIKFFYALLIITWAFQADFRALIIFVNKRSIAIYISNVKIKQKKTELLLSISLFSKKNLLIFLYLLNFYSDRF